MRRALLGVTVVAMLATGCSTDESTEDLESVRAAAAASASQPHRLLYREEVDDRVVEVEALVEDGFRYKARVRLDGVDVYEEVAVDDALAAHVLHPAGLELMAADSPEDADTVTALTAGAWVVDEAGAPGALFTGLDASDPVTAARSYLGFVASTVVETQRPEPFNPFAIDYDPDDDPFPAPDDRSSIERYDARPNALPKEGFTEGGNQVVPDVDHFRKVAVYVEGGRVTQALEVVDVESRLDRLEAIYDLDLDSETSATARARLAMAAINAVRRGQGNPEIVVRTVSLEVSRFGDETIAVALPDGAVAGDLSVLVGRGGRAAAG